MLRHVRLYARLRSAHLERAHRCEPATILYRERRDDFHPALLDGLDVRQVGPGALTRLLLAHRVDVLEINEPLMLDAIRRTALGVALVRLRGGVAGYRTLLVTYAIANFDPFARVDPHPAHARPIRRWLRTKRDAFLARRVWAAVDRVAFGTTAARQVYDARLGKHPTSAVIEALPAPAMATATPSRVPERVAFVGAFSARKGLPQLLDAWPRVKASLPHSTLVLVGSGPLEARARALEAQSDGVQVLTNPPRHTISEHLSAAQVLVLPSQPTPRWREQVGLPIVEGLAHGCAVVTTSETGLAPWLAAHGHQILPPAAPAEALADAITHALRSGRSARSVQADLPPRDGRLVADECLFGSGNVQSNAER